MRGIDKLVANFAALVEGRKSEADYKRDALLLRLPRSKRFVRHLPGSRTRVRMESQRLAAAMAYRGSDPREEI
jgi:hypothetical protein